MEILNDPEVNSSSSSLCTWNSPLVKLKTNWYFTKWSNLNEVLVIQYFSCFFKNFRIFQVHFDISIRLNMLSKVKKIQFKLYTIWNDFFFFLETVIFTTLFRHLLTFWNSTLKMTMLLQRCITLFWSTLKYTALIRRCLTLSYVATFVSTKTQRWNNVEMFAWLT